jgi:hypothetical protein
LRRAFEGVVAMSIAAGLVGGEAFSIDASLIKADVDRKKRIPGDQPFAWPKAEEASHAVREYLAALDAAGGDEDVVEMMADRAKAAIDASLPKRSRLPIRKRHGLRDPAWTHSLPMTRTT